MSNTDDISIAAGSGNVFADLGLEAPDEAFAKAKLANTISTIIARRHLTQAQAAVILGIDQPKVSALQRGRLTGFSIERLLRLLMALDRDIDITIKPKPRRSVHGRINVLVTSPRARGSQQPRKAEGHTSSRRLLSP